MKDPKANPSVTLILLIFKSNYCMLAGDLFSDKTILLKPHTAFQVEVEPWRFPGLSGSRCSSSSSSSCGRVWASDLSRPVSPAGGISQPRRRNNQVSYCRYNGTEHSVSLIACYTVGLFINCVTHVLIKSQSSTF